MNDWWGLAVGAFLGGAVIDLTLFGWSVRALGLGRRFDGAASDEHVAFHRRVDVHYGPIGINLAWIGRLLVTDRRIVSCWGYWSRVAVLEIARTEITEVRRGWFWWYPCVRVAYRRKQRLRSFRIVGGLRMLRSRDELLAAFQSARYPVVA